MTRQLALLLGVATWGAAIFAATQLHRLDVDLGRGVCGPWGCAAEPEALFGYHLFLLALVAPGLALLAWQRPPREAVRLGRAAMTAGALGVVGLVAWGAVGWLRGGGSPEFTLQSGLFRLATTPDLPAVPLLVGGLAARLVGWVRGGCCAPKTDGPTPLESPSGDGET